MSAGKTKLVFGPDGVDKDVSDGPGHALPVGLYDADGKVLGDTRNPLRIDLNGKKLELTGDALNRLDGILNVLSKGIALKGLQTTDGHLPIMISRLPLSDGAATEEGQREVYYAFTELAKSITEGLGVTNANGPLKTVVAESELPDGAASEKTLEALEKVLAITSGNIKHLVGIITTLAETVNEGIIVKDASLPEGAATDETLTEAVGTIAAVAELIGRNSPLKTDKGGRLRTVIEESDVADMLRSEGVTSHGEHKGKKTPFQLNADGQLYTTRSKSHVARCKGHMNVKTKYVRGDMLGDAIYFPAAETGILKGVTLQLSETLGPKVYIEDLHLVLSDEALPDKNGDHVSVDPGDVMILDCLTFKEMKKVGPNTVMTVRDMDLPFECTGHLHACLMTTASVEPEAGDNWQVTFHMVKD